MILTHNADVIDRGKAVPMACRILGMSACHDGMKMPIYGIGDATLELPKRIIRDEEFVLMIFGLTGHPGHNRRYLYLDFHIMTGDQSFHTEPVDITLLNGLPQARVRDMDANHP
jgi:hypothetical protein